MREIKLSAGKLFDSLLALSETEQICLLDSGGVSYLDSHFLFAGINPVESLSLTDDNPDRTLERFERQLSENFASLFTISYEFGLKLNRIEPREKEFKNSDEPDIFIASFENLIVHDYREKLTFIIGKPENFERIERTLHEYAERSAGKFNAPENFPPTKIESNFTRSEYLEKIGEIQEFIRRGDTYQTNLTQQIRARLSENLSPQQIFYNLRKNHPAAFAAFLKRNNDSVVSASPERFFRVRNENISTSPIKGTRPRGKTPQEDRALREELLNSAKDRAENVMIVDLLRNDLGRICRFGSVEVEKLCDLETHPTLFHLVSTVAGELRETISVSDIIRAVFPCGSITGAPKISTMRIIDRLETAARGLSMGAIGISVNNGKRKKEKGKSNFDNSENPSRDSRFTIHDLLDLSVAIRTMVIKNGEAVFNVGGGIVIDSDAEEEYAETLTKAEALLGAINADLSENFGNNFSPTVSKSAERSKANG